MKITDDNAKRIFDMISKWESESLTEEQIVNRLLTLINKDNENQELRYDINDALNWKGYSYQFELIQYEKKKYEPNEYFNLTQNITKSKSDKTKDFIVYLSEMQDSRLTLNSLHYIKLSKLAEVSNIDFSNQYFDKYKNDNLYNLYMSFFTEEGQKEKELKDIIEYILQNIGMPFITMEYMQFRMHVEYLLSTISNNKKISNGYVKANSIKVAFSICPREYLTVNGKEYFSNNIQQSLVKYLALIDKKEIKRIKTKYQDIINQIDNDNGYKLLFNML